MKNGELKQIAWNSQYKIWKKGDFRAKNIFDIQYNARKRTYKTGELFSTNELYSLGYTLRHYSGYYKQVYCATEHFVQPDTFHNAHEYRDNDRKILLVPSKHRRDELQPLSDKLMIPYGPGAIPYATNIYSDVAMDDVKSFLGKTLLVFPRHSNVGMRVMANKNEFAEYVNDIVKKYSYDTVLCCLYFTDIERGAYLEYQRYGWIPVTAGHRDNYDFADCLRTIISLADHVIVHGHGSHLSYAGYLKKPVTFYPADRTIFIEGQGADVNHNPWAKRFEDVLLENYGEYKEDYGTEQYERFDELFGYSDVRTPEELRAILEFAHAIEKDKQIDVGKIQNLLQKDKFKSIKGIVEEAIECRAQAKDNK